MWEDFNESLAELRDRGRLRSLRPRQIDGVHLIDSDGNQLINFGSNDYLGLATKVASEIPAPSAVGSTASGLVCGWSDRHQFLAQSLAAFEGTEAALVFPSGYAACSGTIATLCRRGDLILSDALNHASLIDGCRLSKAQRIIYPHCDLTLIRELLAQRRQEFGRVWIVTDTVFGMDGHVAPLPELCEIADRFDACLIVDEAHATGILGPSGTGACEAFGLKQQVPIRIGTLSKALGSQGGFVACPQVVADFLTNHCRPFIFSTALAMPAVEAAIVALANPPERQQRGTRVRSLARRVRAALELRCDRIESEIPIIPIVIGADDDAVTASQRLQQLGMFVPAIRPPTVPESESRLRVSLSACHSDEMIGRLIAGLQSL